MLLQACSKDKVDEKVVYKKGNFTIRLIYVIDKRCPLEYACLTPGYVNFDLEFQKGLKKEVVPIEIYGQGQSTVDTTMFGYHVLVKDILPYPTTEKSFELSDYEVKIEVN